MGVPLKFNGTYVTRNNSSITLRAAVTDRQFLEPIRIPLSKDAYVSQRARGSYIAVVCRPDLVHGFSIAAQFPNPLDAQAKELNKFIKVPVETKEQGLAFVPSDMDSIFVGVYTKASFPNKPDFASQHGFITTLLDANMHCNIVNYGSVKCKRVTRELYAITYGFDQSYVIKRAVETFLGRTASHVHRFIELFESLTTLNTTTENRLLIDISMLRKSYQRREIDDIYWIPGGQTSLIG